jgi:hypothetical protein
MSDSRLEWGFIQTPADAEPRPLTAAEAQELFTAMAAKGDKIAFRYLYEGCECRAQLMIEEMVAMGIEPGRAWILSVGRKLSVPDPMNPSRAITWENHTAPTVVIERQPNAVCVIDPSLSKTGPMTLATWTGMVRARSIEVSQTPLTQAQILDLQTSQVLGGAEPLDAVVFLLDRGTAPLPDIGGSGFRIGADPPEGVSAFAHAQMQEFLRRQDQMRPGGW